MKKNNLIIFILCIFQLFVFSNQNINAMAEYSTSNIKMGGSSLTNFGQSHPNEDTFCNIKNPKNLPFLKFYAGLFDGHGGGDISRIAKQRLYEIIESKLLSQCQDLESQLASSQLVGVEEILKSSFIELDQEIKDILSQGCTASICVLINNDLYLANAGDSRIIVSRDKSLDFATTDHKPNNLIEKTRIEQEGGSIWCNGTMMLDGEVIKYAVMPEGEQVWRIGPLGVSRSIGDYTDQDAIDGIYNWHDLCRNKLRSSYEKKGVPLAELSRDNFSLAQDGRIVGFSCIPDVKRIEIDSSYNFIVLASDGLWDVVGNEEVIEFVQNGLDDGHDVQEITDKLVQIAQDIGSGDDITVTIVEFDWNLSRSLTKKSDQKKPLSSILKSKVGFLHKKLPKQGFFTY